MVLPIAPRAQRPSPILPHSERLPGIDKDVSGRIGGRTLVVEDGIRELYGRGGRRHLARRHGSRSASRYYGFCRCVTVSLRRTRSFVSLVRGQEQ